MSETVQVAISGRAWDRLGDGSTGQRQYTGGGLDELAAIRAVETVQFRQKGKGVQALLTVDWHGAVYLKELFEDYAQKFMWFTKDPGHTVDATACSNAAIRMTEALERLEEPL
jgi:hypothetical protein